jgi:hypothetical protein
LQCRGDDFISETAVAHVSATPDGDLRGFAETFACFIDRFGQTMPPERRDLSARPGRGTGKGLGTETALAAVAIMIIVFWAYCAADASA